jgi:predicted enzyme related to lactoylglutathione lyase
MQRREMLGVLGAAAGMTILPESISSAQQKPIAVGEQRKEGVTGIGGFFFRAKDPKALAQWYQDHLGVLVTPEKAGDPVWTQQSGPTSFTPFPEKTSYFGDSSKQWMINFRVGNLDRLAAQLQAAGIVVKVDATVSPYGRFAHLHDPEGNGIELWQPV